MPPVEERGLKARFGSAYDQSTRTAPGQLQTLHRPLHCSGAYILRTGHGR